MLTLTKSHFSEINSVNINNRDTRKNTQRHSTPATGGVRKALLQQLLLLRCLGIHTNRVYLLEFIIIMSDLVIINLQGCLKGQKLNFNLILTSLIWIFEVRFVPKIIICYLNVPTWIMTRLLYFYRLL